MSKALPAALAAAVLALGAATAEAWHVEGYVVCDVNQDGYIDVGDTPLAGVRVVVVSTGGAEFVAFTDANGYYYITLPDVVDSYVAALDPNTLPADGAIIMPVGGSARSGR